MSRLKGESSLTLSSENGPCSFCASSSIFFRIPSGMLPGAASTGASDTGAGFRSASSCLSLFFSRASTSRRFAVARSESEGTPFSSVAFLYIVST